MTPAHSPARKDTKLIEVDMHDPRVKESAYGDRHYIRLDHSKVWIPETPTTASGNPTSAMFSDGNGGEYRMSYHGFASPTAYVIESPESLTVVPMQIDTHVTLAARPTLSPPDPPAAI